MQRAKSGGNCRSDRRLISQLTHFFTQTDPVQERGRGPPTRSGRTKRLRETACDNQVHLGQNIKRFWR